MKKRSESKKIHVSLAMPKKVCDGYRYEVTEEQIKQFVKLSASEKLALLEKAQKNLLRTQVKKDPRRKKV